MRILRSSITGLFVFAMVAVALAQIVRDRAAWIVWFMYVPMLPLALSATLWELALRGRALPRRWTLLAAAFALSAIAVALQWSPARAPEAGAGEVLRVVQWNTRWGGPRGRESVRAMFARVAEHQPDIVCMSEAPAYENVQAEWSQRAPRAYYATSTNGPFYLYQYRMTVISRSPVEVTKEWNLQAGHAALFELAQPRPLRIVMVDLKSEPSAPRSPSLAQVAQHVHAEWRAGRPIDLVLGDFNTPGRFLGFDALAQAGEGYERTAFWSGQWRATWPSALPLPLFDIDHIFVRSGVRVRHAEFFGHPATDHRGQVAVVRLP